MRKLILVSIVFASLTGLLFFASEGRPQDAVVLRTDLRFAALPADDDVSGRRGRARNAHVSREQLDPLLRQLRDPDDRAGDLIAFLEPLTDDSFDRTVPVKVPSGLKPGGNIQ